MERHIEKKFGLIRDFDYIKINFYLMYKRILEYKSNLWIILLEQIIYIFTFIFFFNILFTNFENIISWNLKDFILFFIIYDFAQVFVGIYGWNFTRLNQDIKSGELNIYLLRPIKSYRMWFFHEPNIVGVIYTILQVLIYGIFLFIYNIDVVNIFYGILIFLLVCLMFICQMEFIKSLDFIKIGIFEIFQGPVESIYNIVRSFPAPFFKNNFLKYLFFSVPYFFVGSLIIPLIRGYEIWNLELQLSILIGFTLFFFVGSLVNWHYGLKKYEAFG